MTSDSPAPLFSRYRLLNVSELRSLAKLLRARAMLHVRAGDHASAMKDVQAIRRVADHCAQTPDVITWLVALAMDAEGLQSARAAMSDADLDERTLLAWSDLCKPRPLAPPPCLLNHRFEMLDQWCTLAREGPKGFGSSSEPDSNPAKYYVLPVHYDAWLRVANTYHDELLKAWTMSNVNDAVAAMDAASDVYAQSKSVWPWINMLHGLGSAAQASRWRMLDEQNRVEAHLNLTAIALKRHRLAHGAYPNDLAALTPKHLPAAPADPFAPGSELKYRREGSGFTLYSVGRDGIDDNGQPSDPERPRKTFDLVVQANR